MGTVRRRIWLAIALGAVMLVAATIVGTLATTGAFSGGHSSASVLTTSTAPTTPASVIDVAPTFTMQGVFDLFVASDTGSPSLADGTACTGKGASSDIALGTLVRIYDGQGKKLGIGSLGLGSYASMTGGGVCKFLFHVNDVPDGLISYSVQIGQRGVKVVSSGEAHYWVFLSDGP